MGLLISVALSHLSSVQPDDGHCNDTSLTFHVHVASERLLVVKVSIPKQDSLSEATAYGVNAGRRISLIHHHRNAVRVYPLLPLLHRY
jgi:hypothetical protein